ncbi:hypothetical protein EDC94DRAFT_658757 [Helicostylum pulchrum]|nr:hypothetical protein EDC94DRAFT_658757 [Helicostylum pulchrum]
MSQKTRFFWLLHNKKHLNESYLFDKAMIMLYSECDFAAKFWGPMIEKVFKDSDVITQWGDRMSTSQGIYMKMDLRLTSSD